MAKVSRLYHYPIKGLSPQTLKQVVLEKGKGFPFDRVYGIARHDSGYDPVAYKPLPKTHFIVLVKEERLATLKTHFDTTTHHLHIRAEGYDVFDEDISTEMGREKMADYFATLFHLSDVEKPIIAVGENKRFTDISVHSETMMHAVSLINLNSIRDLEARTATKINPLRFRGNIYLEDMPAYQEFDCLNQDILIGETRLKIFRRTRRCAATDVNPDTAIRDLAIPRMLMETLGHADMGVYAEVMEGGPIEIGSVVKLPAL